MSLKQVGDEQLCVPDEKGCGGRGGRGRGGRVVGGGRVGGGGRGGGLLIKTFARVGIAS